jgi:hypothetical protein
MVYVEHKGKKKTAIFATEQEYFPTFVHYNVHQKDAAMRVISSAEFRGNMKKYLDIASTESEKIVIQRGRDETFELTKGTRYKKPDDDFYRSISIDEFRERTHQMIHEMYKLPR